VREFGLESLDPFVDLVVVHVTEDRGDVGGLALAAHTGREDAGDARATVRR